MSLKADDAELQRKLESNGKDSFRGYGMMSEIEGNEKKIRISLSPYFLKIQEAIGFSVSDIFESGPDALRFAPAFGKPKARAVDVFAIMPFAAEFDIVYVDVIQKACADLHLGVVRGDDIFGSEQVIMDIWSSIYSSKHVIADCSGRNANVFYELGIAHAIGRRAIMITQDADRVPFDVSHWRWIRYDTSRTGLRN